MGSGRAVPEEGKPMRVRHVGRGTVFLGPGHWERLRTQVALDLERSRYQA